jgi:hypothetical protein
MELLANQDALILEDSPRPWTVNVDRDFYALVNYENQI